MKVLMIDRDRNACDLLRPALEEAGVQVTFEETKNAAAERLRQESFDVILLDPAPQNDFRSFIMSVRRASNTFPPMVVLSHTLELDKVLEGGGNACIKKPLDVPAALKTITDAARITRISNLMADESEDFPSKEGIIAKSAFNQLYITCLDRADRHGEGAHIIFVSIDNFDDIIAADGQEEADKVAKNLRKTISRTRRTSDIAGHIGKAEFCLLLLRPMKEGESLLAASRFAETMKSNIDIISTSKTPAVLKIWIFDIPSGSIPAEHVITKG